MRPWPGASNRGLRRLLAPCCVGKQKETSAVLCYLSSAPPLPPPPLMSVLVVVVDVVVVVVVGVPITLLYFVFVY